MSVQKSFAEMVRDVREAYGWTVEELAEKSKTTVQDVESVEAGEIAEKSMIGQEIARAICREEARIALETGSSMSKRALATLSLETRERLGLSKREAAKRAGVSHNYVFLVETGNMTSNAPGVKKLLAAYGLIDPPEVPELATPDALPVDDEVEGLSEEEFDRRGAEAHRMIPEFIKEARKRASTGNDDLFKQARYIETYLGDDVDICIERGRLYRLERRYGDALFELEKALLLFAVSGLAWGDEELTTARAEYEIALVHHERGSHSVAIEHLKAVEYCFEFTNVGARSDRVVAGERYMFEGEDLLAKARTMLAVISAHIGELEAADAYAKAALSKLPVDLPNRKWFLARIRYVSGEVSFQNSAYMQAVSFYNEALRYFNDVGDNYSACQMAYNAALSYARAGLIRSARDYMKDIESNQFATDTERVKVAILRAEIDIERDPDRAIQRAHDIAADKRIDPFLRAEAFEVAAKAYKWKNDLYEHQTNLGAAIRVMLTETPPTPAARKTKKRLTDEYLAESLYIKTPVDSVPYEDA